MSWIYLIVAIAMEVGGTTAMKLSEGFTKPLWAITMTVCYAAAFALLTLAQKELPLSLTYAVWAGAGTVLIAGISVIIFGEPLTVLKIISIVLITAGIIGLNLSGGAQ